MSKTGKVTVVKSAGRPAETIFQRWIHDGYSWSFDNDYTSLKGAQQRATREPYCDCIVKVELPEVLPKK
ncbi:hypothetical protein LCGC14_0297870 [marine sediment metagenome]|uniref:Uncharacterized protein n=1 Tax=marine sediment metagenome TaxID=412755 RepID=A0A0F9WX17_9ZZZZ